MVVREFGFATKQATTEAEAVRRIKEQKRHEIAQAGGGVAEAVWASR